jgi:hypothetical protein
MRYFYRSTRTVGPIATGTLVEYTGERWNRLANESVVRIATAEGATHPLRRSVFDRSFTKEAR